jgi:hypothetical protein
MDEEIYKPRIPRIGEYLYFGTERWMVIGGTSTREDGRLMVTLTLEIDGDDLEERGDDAN